MLPGPSKGKFGAPSSEDDEGPCRGGAADLTYTLNRRLAPKRMKEKLLLIRHGETEWTADNAFRGLDTMSPSAHAGARWPMLANDHLACIGGSRGGLRRAGSLRGRPRSHATRWRATFVFRGQRWTRLLRLSEQFQECANAIRRGGPKAARAVNN